MNKNLSTGPEGAAAAAAAAGMLSCAFMAKLYVVHLSKNGQAASKHKLTCKLGGRRY